MQSNPAHTVQLTSLSLSLQSSRLQHGQVPPDYPAGPGEPSRMSTHPSRRRGNDVWRDLQLPSKQRSYGPADKFTKVPGTKKPHHHHRVSCVLWFPTSPYRSSPIRPGPSAGPPGKWKLSKTALDTIHWSPYSPYSPRVGHQKTSWAMGELHAAPSFPTILHHHTHYAIAPMKKLCFTEQNTDFGRRVGKEEMAHEHNCTA